MNTREEETECDLFLDELSYLLGPVIGLYKTTKNSRKYIISGLNSIDEELKGITFASFNNNLNVETCIKYIDHWIHYIQRMKIECWTSRRGDVLHDGLLAAKWKPNVQDDELPALLAVLRTNN